MIDGLFGPGQNFSFRSRSRVLQNAACRFEDARVALSVLVCFLVLYGFFFVFELTRANFGASRGARVHPASASELQQEREKFSGETRVARNTTNFVTGAYARRTSERGRERSERKAILNSIGVLGAWLYTYIMEWIYTFEWREGEILLLLVVCKMFAKKKESARLSFFLLLYFAGGICREE